MTQSRWYPSEQQLKDPASLKLAFKQLLDQHYTLVDHVAKQQAAAPAAANTMAGHGPTDTKLLGLNVVPIDTESIADGVKLTYEKKSGTLVFK